jgi:fimbrial chaperone protein
MRVTSARLNAFLLGFSDLFLYRRFTIFANAFIAALQSRVMRQFGLFSLGIVGVAVANTPSAHAATLQISPVLVNFGAATNATGLTLINPSDAALYGQVRVFRWAQINGEDQLTPTEDLIASPPLIQVAGKADQLVRLVRRTTSSTPIEQSYRLLIDELPAPDENNPGGVTIRLRYSVPVFVEPSQPNQQPVLTWQLEHSAGHWVLNVLNTGVRHAQISAVTVLGTTGTTYTISKGLLGYALAGAGRSWQVPLPNDASIANGSKIHAMINAVPSDATVALGTAP